MESPYVEALTLVKQHNGTSGQTALAKCILSLYNSLYAYSMSEILAPLDERYTRVVLAMVNDYAKFGETPELITAGQWVRDDFPRMMEMAIVTQDARNQLRSKWEREREEENRRLYPEEY
ncbi:hypothetical protein [Deefgea sp. CFH1-16]|uniref:hypothetical protein n=1 Tax=Deefgea sp. CFH1-16 TaxID=2675457 RepID=UPI0015F6AE74|nr:hypothetical protein [Deefgea sp. CFH1-16]MBM5575795.1 hypothetical protein [Deefgea sp. CFH1-16]